MVQEMHTLYKEEQSFGKWNFEKKDVGLPKVWAVVYSFPFISD